MSAFKSLVSRRLRLTSGPGALDRLRRELALGLGLGVRNPEALAMVMLAVEEAAANILEHGYRDRRGRPITIAIRIDGQERITVILRDRAPVVDVTAIPAADLEDLARRLAVRGRGLAMMRRLAETVRHRARPGGGNELTLTFDAGRLAGDTGSLGEQAA